MKSLTSQQLENLRESSSFCISPWIHMHLWPDGKVFPCCMTPPTESVGDLNTKSLFEIWNSKEMKTLRQQMLNGEKPSSCTRCYEHESFGSGSLRKYFYYQFKDKYTEVNKTQDDGGLEKINMSYMDIRFSNVCNFKCRTCGLPLSSGWYDDAKSLNPELNEPKQQKVVNNSTELWKQLEPVWEQLEEVYFVGGEPMFMEEHWEVLNELDKRGAYHIRLKYNTNFSTLKYKNYDAIEYWKKFKNVKVGASLDGADARGEYIRKGMNWKKIEENRLELLNKAPHVSFEVNSTVSNMNVLHLPDFHMDWLNKKWVEPDGIILSLLLFPEFYRVQVLPPEIKSQVEKKYTEFIQFLNANYEQKSAHLISFSEALIKFMREDASADLMQEFRSMTGKLDILRKENFIEKFPELKTMMERV